jgi:hypothetical protein
VQLAELRVAVVEVLDRLVEQDRAEVRRREASFRPQS